MSQATLNALEKVFAAEIENRLPFQSKAKIYAKLRDEGYLDDLQIKMGIITVRGYGLTHMGRYVYCSNCPEAPEID